MRASAPADELTVAKRSLRDLWRKKLKGKKELSPEMRDLMVSFEAQYERRHTPNTGRPSQDEQDQRQ